MRQREQTECQRDIVHQCPYRADPELPFEPEPDIHGNAKRCGNQREQTFVEQFAGDLAGDRVHAIDARLGMVFLHLGDDLFCHFIGKFGILVSAVGKFHADRNLIFLAETLDRRIAITELANAFAQRLDRCRLLANESGADHLAADEIDTKVETAGRDQRDRSHHQQDGEPESDVPPFQEADIGVVGNELQKFHGSNPRLKY